MAALVLMFPLATAQVDPGLRNPVDAGGPINDVALAVDSGHFAAAIDDPGGRFEPITGPEPNAPTWSLWVPSGERIEQDDGVDPEQCDDADLTDPTLPEPGIPDDCQTDAVSVALSTDGQRLVVAGNADGSAEVVFATAAEAGIHQESVSGTVTDLAMSDDGRQVAIVTAEGNGGAIHLYRWTSSVSHVWTEDAGSAFSHVAVSPDGDTVVAGAGDVHYRYFTGSSDGDEVADEDFPDTLLDIAIADDADHVSIAGADSGHFVLYEDDTAPDRRAFRSKHTDDAVTAVAISADAATFAVGNDQGTIWLYALDRSDFTIELLGKSVLGDAVSDLRFDGGADLLAAASDAGVTLFDVRDDLQDLWHDARDGIGVVHISRDGNTLLTGAGEEVLVYDAIHNLSHEFTTLPDETVPGEQATIELLLKNDGNRAESVPLGADLPSDWSAVTTPGVVDLLPGEERNVTLRLSVPAGHAPGPATVDLLVGGFDPIPVPLEIPEHDAWGLQAGDDVQSRGTDNDGAARFTVQIENQGNLEGVPELEVSGEEPGWDMRLEGASAPIAPGDSVEARLIMQAPEGADELDRATAVVSIGGATPTSLEYTATVGARFAMDLDTPAGHVAPAGNLSSFQVTVTNDGNTVDGVRLRLESIPEGWTARFQGSDRVRVVSLIDAGDAVTEQVELIPPGDVPEGPPFQITVRATSLGDDSRSSSANILVTVEEAAEGGGGDGRTIPAVGVPALLLAFAFVARRRIGPKRDS